MSTALTSILGVLFLLLGAATTFSMYQFWGYPYDEVKKVSSCPQWKMNIHRVLGIAFAVVYIVLMIEMVPRLWTYQVEFPARTVAHILLGFTIGFILLLKICILRFFRHFEEWMPALGTVMLLCTFLLLGMSLPFAIKEHVFARSLELTPDKRARMTQQLERIDFGYELDPTTLISDKVMKAGRQVLLRKCVYCHDLRTSITKPRTASNWWKVVSRMADKPTFGARLSERDLETVTAYLVAVTPDLQKSVKRKRKQRAQQTDTKKLAQAPTPPVVAPVDMAKATETYEEVCSGCHNLSDVDDQPPSTRDEVDELLQRMIDENDLEASPEELELVRGYLVATFAKDSEPPPTPQPDPAQE